MSRITVSSLLAFISSTRPLLLSLVLAVSFIPRQATSAPEPPGAERDRLTHQELTSPPKRAAELVHNGYFMPVGVSGPAHHSLNGVLEVPRTDAFVVKGRFPSFKVEFFTYKDRLVPTVRDIIRSDFDLWDIILSPGRVWAEAADQGWSRASFPFVLVGRQWNESHNGLATFLFNDTEVSRLSIQIVQEATSWNRFDAAGSLPLVYLPGAVDGKRAFADEIANELPIRPFSALNDTLNANLLSAFDSKAGHVTFAGLLVDGVLYAQACKTRYGDYPYCREMRHGVYSVTKTAGAGLGLLWLARKYGDEVFDLKITDYLEVTATHDGWDEVTFADTLNMMTGVGDLAPRRESSTYVFEADEDSPILPRVARASSIREKLNIAFSAGNYAWGPGEVGRYNSIHTTVLAAAMDAFLKQKEGPAANLWDRITDEVLNPIGVLYAPMMHSRESDGGRGVPVMGWGLFPTAEELLRIAELLQNRGVSEERQLLSRTRLDSLFSATEPGYPIVWDTVDGRYRYYGSFWFRPFRDHQGCAWMLPELLGYGGNLVVLMPNGMIGIRLADAPEGTSGMYDSLGMIQLANALRSFCS